MKMSRREALHLGMIAAASATPLARGSASTLKTIRPPRLNEGDVVAVISPAGVTSDPLDLDIARSNLALLGLKMKVAPHALERYGYLGGTDKQRAQDFNQMVNDDSVKGIVCMRGGYGTTRMLEYVDYGAFGRNAKVVWGFSDITGLLNALNVKTGVITFHAPTATSNWGPYDLDSMRKVMMLGQYGEPYPAFSGEPVPVAATLVPGRATGRLVGGNLSLLAAVGGSAYAPNLEGAIVFIEEIGEDPYRVDRMLTQLWLDGSLRGANGIVFGVLRPRAGQVPEASPGDWSMLDVLSDRAKLFGIPCFTGFPSGHIADQVTMPIGTRAEMNSDERSLRLLDPAVT